MYNLYSSNSINTKWFILFGIILHFVASFFSIGYYNLDEHFQVLEPLAKLLELENSLTWEFDYKIRPWLQSTFYYVITKIIYIFDFTDPFEITFVLRLSSSIIGFISIVFLYNHTKEKFNIQNNFSKFLIFGFWFYAFLHARTSSENLSISMLIFGFVFFDRFVESKNSKELFFYSLNAGIFLGLSMVLKYQIVISVIFIYLWFIIHHLNFRKLIYLINNFLIIILILFFGLIVDYFNYSSINITYYKYYHANFVENWFESFGKDPWWYYLRLLVVNFFPPIGLIFLISLIFFWINNFKTIITYLTLPVFLILSYLSHKELRFLFPILIFTPFIISYIFSNTNNFYGKVIITNLIILFNFLFYIVLLIPATEQVKIYKYLYYNNNEDMKIFYTNENPYRIDGLEPKFYTSFLPEIRKFEENTYVPNSLLVSRNQNEINEIIDNSNCNIVYSVYPDIIKLNKNWKDREFNWYVIYCN